MAFQPTIVYRNPGKHRGPKGSTYDYLGVNSAEELKQAKAAGWRETLDGAASEKAEAVIEQAEDLDEAIDEISAPTREELEKKADELEIPYNSRTKDETLVKRIAEALAE